MKNFKLFLFNILSLLYLEVLAAIVFFHEFKALSFITILLFLIPITCLITFFMSVFNKKGNFIVGIIIHTLLSVWFSLQIVFKKIFAVFFQVSLFTLSDQATSFSKEAISFISSNIHFILLTFIPLVILIIFRNKILSDKSHKKYYIIVMSSVCITSMLFFAFINMFMKNT